MGAAVRLRKGPAGCAAAGLLVLFLTVLLVFGLRERHSTHKAQAKAAQQHAHDHFHQQEGSVERKHEGKGRGSRSGTQRGREKH